MRLQLDDDLQRAAAAIATVSVAALAVTAIRRRRGATPRGGMRAMS